MKSIVRRRRGAFTLLVVLVILLVVAGLAAWFLFADSGQSAPPKADEKPAPAPVERPSESNGGRPH